MKVKQYTSPNKSTKTPLPEFCSGTLFKNNCLNNNKRSSKGFDSDNLNRKLNTYVYVTKSPFSCNWYKDYYTIPLNPFNILRQMY